MLAPGKAPQIDSERYCRLDEPVSAERPTQLTEPDGSHRQSSHLRY